MFCKSLRTGETSDPANQELQKGKLMMEFIKGRDISLPASSKKKPNSFLKIFSSEETFSSSVVKNSSSPEWKYSVEISTHNLTSPYIDLQVVAQDKKGQESVLGCSRILLADLLETENHSQWASLQDSPGSVMYYAKFVPDEVIATILDDSESKLTTETETSQTKPRESSPEQTASLDERIRGMFPADDNAQVVAIEVSQADYEGIET